MLNLGGDGGIRTHEAQNGLRFSKPVQLATMRRLQFPVKLYQEKRLFVVELERNFRV